MKKMRQRKREMSNRNEDKEAKERMSKINIKNEEEATEKKRRDNRKNEEGAKNERESKDCDGRALGNNGDIAANCTSDSRHSRPAGGGPSATQEKKLINMSRSVLMMCFLLF